MHKFFVEKENLDLENRKIIINSDDVKHIKNVLRCKINDRLEISVLENDRFQEYIVEIDRMDEEILCNIIEEKQINNESKIYVHIIQAIPKADKMEFIIQKCTEIRSKRVYTIRNE